MVQYGETKFRLYWRYLRSDSQTLANERGLVGEELASNYFLLNMGELQGFFILIWAGLLNVQYTKFSEIIVYLDTH